MPELHFRICFSADLCPSGRTRCSQLHGSAGASGVRRVYEITDEANPVAQTEVPCSPLKSCSTKKSVTAELPLSHLVRLPT
jgi:hypothetical protein